MFRKRFNSFIVASVQKRCYAQQQQQQAASTAASQQAATSNPGEQQQQQQSNQQQQKSNVEVTTSQHRGRPLKRRMQNESSAMQPFSPFSSEFGGLRNDPFSIQIPSNLFSTDLRQMMNVANSLWNQFMTPWSQMEKGARAGNMWMPLMDVKETKDSYEMEADIPGMKKDDIKIEFDEDSKMLTIHGESQGVERRSSKDESGEKSESGTWHTVERRYGRFYRAMNLPDDAKAEDIAANYQDGVLKITIPKSQQKEKHEPHVKSIKIE